MAAGTELHPPRPMSFEPLDTTADRDVGRLLVSCADRPGICAAICGYLAGLDANITSLQQYTTDPSGGRLFLRVEFLLPGLDSREAEVGAGFGPLADSFRMDWRLARAKAVKRLAIMVSKTDHALQELLWRRKAGDLHAEIAMVISNHDDLRPLVETWGIPYHHVPVTPETKPAAEQMQLELLRGQVDAVVLARYMQVLSPTFLAAFPNRAINIHHSFLPAFLGADPYGKAAERGVKLIGATAHYVTEDLDAGPIIEQDVVRIDHRQSVTDLRRAGRYVERAVLARAVGWHVEDRVIVHKNKTIVFA
jgi:formyltetrahydrofolate deformylase